MNYQKYPDSKNTPNRKTRKSERNKIFMANSGLSALKRRERKVARRAAEEAAELEE